MPALLGEFAQGPLAPRHDLARDGHLRVELGLGRAQLNPARRLADRQSPTHGNVEMRQHLLRQDDAGAIADLLDLELRVHTGVITHSGAIFNAVRGAR